LICIHPNYFFHKGELQFDSLWEECVQEEERVGNREEILSRDEYKGLAYHTKGEMKRSYLHKETNEHKESQPPNKFIHK
jgi:hypothetical protein